MRKYTMMIQSIIQMITTRRHQKCKVRCQRMNPGCVACGNPTYPECMTHCPMYDD